MDTTFEALYKRYMSYYFNIYIYERKKSVVIFISGGNQRDKQYVKSLQSNARQTPSDCGDPSGSMS